MQKDTTTLDEMLLTAEKVGTGPESKNGSLRYPEMPAEEDALILYSGLLNNRVRKIAKFKKFPSPQEMSVIETYSILRNDLKAVMFEQMPNEGKGFSQEDAIRMKSLAKKMPFIWYFKEDEEGLVFHDKYFMSPETIPHYDSALKNGKTVSLFGSAKIYDPAVHYELISNAMDSVKRVLGEDAFVFHGGGPGIMQAFSEIAKDKGLRVGTSSITLDVEAKTGFKSVENTGVNPLRKKNLDATITYENAEIQARQKALLDSATAAAVAFNPGGMGTLSEITDFLNNDSIYETGILSIIAGSSEGCVSGIPQILETGKRNSTIRDRVNVYRSEDGNIDSILRAGYSA